MPSEAGFPSFRRHLKLQNPIHRAVLYVPSCVLKHLNADAPHRLQTASPPFPANGRQRRIVKTRSEK
ncbi:hypothetical protein [Neisseria bergeri]|uniref:hypothetical protein n=1 Tax=Neisseria bergeri TaxID=1906581 RepID=UPI00128FFB70|nr:hypothetical protein [Neisseria bergeri]